ncbi:MAG: hypothetical protein ACFFBP_07570 [Promethearchaeota archaeon]
MYQAAIIFIIFVAVRLITGGAVFINWRKTGKKNLLILLIYFLVNANSLIFLILENLWIYDLSSITALIVILVFIDRTFYKDRTSPFKLLLILSFILGGLVIAFNLIREFSILQPEVAFFIHNIFIGGLFLIYGSWSLIASGKSLRSFISSQAVEPWVKGRYKLVIFYSCSIIIVGLLTPFTPLEGTINWSLLILTVVNVLRITGEALAWIMPNFLKKYYNRGYISPVMIEELSEDEITEGMI